MVDRNPAGARQTGELEVVRCNLCGAQDEALLFVKEGLRIVRCRQCGLAYVNPRLPQSEIAQQYDAGYYTAGSYTDYLSERAGYERTFDLRLAQIERLTRGVGRILDVGCAFGFFLSVAEQRGWEAYGIDLSPVGCQYAAAQLGLRATCTTLAGAGFPPEFFDVVVMNDTFEHLADPTHDLRQARQVLRPGGFLFLVTQDSGRLLVRLLGKRWAQYKPREHLYYFTARTLRRMLEQTGFRVLQIEDEGLVCTVDFLVVKLGNLSRFAGRIVASIVRRLGLGQRLVFVRTGYEVMACVQKV
jgi:2-polyprenyl-3-methyl-5-hydroxy-6-metoxy-1,4-benzoquinol methylase